MSIPYMNRVWNHSALGGSRRLVLLALADYADDAGYCWPGIATLARRCLLTPRQVIRVIADIEQAGEVLVLHRKRGNRYAVNVWPAPYRAENGTPAPFCARCHGIGEPLTLIPLRTHPTDPQVEPRTLVAAVCPECGAALKKLVTLGFEHDLATDMLSRHPDPDTATGQESDVTSCHIETDASVTSEVTPVSPDPPITTNDPPTTIKPVMTEEEAKEWLSETRAAGTSAVLKPGGLDEMSPEEKAAIASPVTPRDPPRPDPAGTWQNTILSARPKRFRYDHGFTDRDVLLLIDHFVNGSGIAPPTTPQEAKRWHAGATSTLYNIWGQFKDMRLGHVMLMRHALWCVDLFFQPYSPLAFMTATSPYSLINVIGRLAADLKAIQGANGLGHGLPTDEQAAAFYANKNGNGKKRTGSRVPAVAPPTGEEEAAMRAAIHGASTGNPLINARQGGGDHE